MCKCGHLFIDAAMRSILDPSRTPEAERPHLTFEIRPYPDWSWSHSRRTTFQECPRKYYYQYYGSHNGWLASAEEDARTAYRLKQLASLPIELGGAVHDAARHSIERVRNGFPEPSFEEVHDRVRADLNNAWLQSKDRAAWERQPNRSKMFHESYYGDGLSESQLTRARDQVVRCLTNLRTSTSYRQALSAPAVEVRTEEFLPPIDIDVTPIYAVPDLHYRLGDGSWTISDWKTGLNEEPDWDQMAVYALFIREKHGVESVIARVEWLSSGNSEVRTISGSGIQDAHGKIANSVQAMRGYLLDVEANRPREKAGFPLRDDTGLCPSCPFYELCRDEIDQRAGNGPF